MEQLKSLRIILIQKRLNVYKGIIVNNILILVSVLVLASCSGGRNSTGYSLINDMVDSLAYEAFSENPHFDDGQSMQAPPANTIARGWMPDKRGSDGLLVVTSNPFPMNDYKWKRAEIFYNKTCSACHGVDGQSTGLVVTVGNFPTPPKFLSRRFKYSKRDDYTSGNIYNVITDGIGNMPSHAQQLYPEDRWAISEYVRERLMIKGK